MSHDYPGTVTLNKKYCHPQCYQVQLNAYMRNTIDPAQLWKTNKGGPSNPVNGECGRMHRWGYCARAEAQGNPRPPTNIVSTIDFSLPHRDDNLAQAKAASGFDWRAAIESAVDETMNIANSQDFRDGNHRTALQYMFDTLNYKGLSIKFDTAGNPEADGFRLYVQLKSLTDQTGKWPLGDRPRVKSEMVKLLKDVVQIRDVTWEERLRLAEFVKTDIPRVLAEVDALHDLLRKIEREQGKRAAEEYYKELKKTNPLLYHRHLYLWGNI